MSNMHQLINGVSQATFYILPIYGKHPDEYPRFRDFFDLGNNVVLYTRTGGPNRHLYEEENAEVYAMPEYVRTFDDPKDETYAYFELSVPEAWQADITACREGRFKDLSDAYWDQLCKIFPKLAAKFTAMKEVARK